MSAADPGTEHPTPETEVEMPAGTAWPMILALGIALLAIGFVTDLVFSGLGAVLMVFGMGGWVRQMLPEVGESREPLRPKQQWARPVRESGVQVEPLREGMPGHRLRIPEKIHPYSAGLKGGFFGGIAMAVLALIYGAVSGHGIWYPVNLLAGTVLPNFGQNVADLERFSWLGLILGLSLHVIASLGNGLLAGILLPMLPGWPLLFAGVVAPLLWSAAVWGFMGVLNPLLHDYVDWPWFIGSQFAYGIVLGVVVTRSEKVPTSDLGSQRGSQTHPGTPSTGGEGPS